MARVMSFTLILIVLVIFVSACSVRVRVGVITPPGPGPCPDYWYVRNAVIDDSGTYFNSVTGDVSFLVNDNGVVRRVEVPVYRVQVLLRIYEYRCTALDAEMTDSYHASEATIYCHTQTTYRYWQDRLASWRRR